MYRVLIAGFGGFLEFVGFIGFLGFLVIGSLREGGFMRVGT